MCAALGGIGGLGTIRSRSLERRVIAGILFTLLTIASGCTSARQAATMPSVQLHVGSAERVLSGLASTPDAKVFTFRCGGTTYGVVSGGRQLDAEGRAVPGGPGSVYRVADPTTIPWGTERLTPLVGLDPGPADFDARGVWLNGIVADGAGVLHAVYHAEQPLPRATANDAARKSLAYAESRDCGATWQKVDYPQNQILTGAPSSHGGAGNAGDARLLVVGQWLYLYYNEEDGPALARSALAEDGRPGTWHKRWCLDATPDRCSFSQPGLGGRGTPVPGRWLDTFPIWSAALHRWLAVDDRIMKGRLVLSSSLDGITWTLLAPQPLLPDVVPSYEFYPSLVGTDGSTDRFDGDTVWLYTVLIAPNRSQRTLLRRAITITGA